MIVNTASTLGKVNPICAFSFFFLDISQPNAEFFNEFLRVNPAWKSCKPLKLMFATLVLPF